MPADFARKLNATALLLEARRRRAVGRYTRATLGVYERAWRTFQAPRNLLHYCLFRHELGYRLPEHLDRLLGQASEHLGGRDHAVAELLRSPGRRMEQSETRRDFALWLERTCDEGIAVVGNSARLLGRGKAAAIEQSGCIVRFNNWRAPAVDVGERTDVWVRSPLDIQTGRSPIPTPPPAWVAVSGPEMGSRRPEWDDWAQNSSGRLVSVPLEAWRGLVRVLGAPPSAGLLSLAWLRSILGAWRGIEVFGVGYDSGRYHAAIRAHRPSRRHDWKKETCIIRQWEAEGLKLN